MKSWAVTRGPSLVPGEKRLAVQVEDHPIEYNAFEGTIPQGEYGGGTVMIWDRGRWEPEDDPHRGSRKGTSIFTLEGEKLRGRLASRAHARQAGREEEHWLLIKARTTRPRAPPKDPDILEEMPLSVVSGRSIQEIAAGKGRKRVWHSNRSVKDNVTGGATKADALCAAQARARPRPKHQRVRAHVPRQPRRRPPRNAPARAAKRSRGRTACRCRTSCRRRSRRCATTAPSGAGWVHEIKFDGYRIQARLDHGKVRLLTRKGLDWTGKFPNVAAAVARLPADTALIDGEIVVEDARGLSDFSDAAGRAQSTASATAFVYYVFDLLHLDGDDLTGLPLIERKAALKDACRQGGEHGHDPLQRAFRGRRPDDLQQACRHGARRHRVEARGCALPHRPVGDVHQDQVLQRPGIRGRRLRAVDRRCRGRSARWWRAITTTASCIYAGRIGTGYTQTRRARSVEAAASAGDRQAAVRSRFRREEARRRDVHWVEPKTVIEAAIPRLDQRQARAAGGVQGRARGQAGERGGARDFRPCAGAQESAASAAPKIAAEASKAMTKTSKAKTRPSESASRRRKPVQVRQSEATSASPIRTASTGPTSASPSRTSPTTIARCGT